MKKKNVWVAEGQKHSIQQGMIKLSYSSLNNLANGHEWLNKQLGIPVPDYPFLREGKEAHRLIQGHMSGKSPYLYLKDLKVNFPIVEEKDFDERCKFSFVVSGKKGDYEIFGYVDGLDRENKRMLEIKTSETDWTMLRFKDAMQRKIYALGFPEMEETLLVTGSKNPEKWSANPPKIYSLRITENDRKEAKAWIDTSISILESGDFSGGLDASGHCLGCFWNMQRFPELANCHFM